MSRRNGTPIWLPSPTRLFFTVLATTFLAEAAVMFLLKVLLPDLHPLADSIADATAMVVLSAPFLWWFLVRPLRRIATAEHVRAATLISRARDGIISMNEQGLIESFNPAAERIFGYRAEEVAGKPLTLLMPERYRDAHQRGVERARATGTSDLLEGRMFEGHGLRKDGTELALECSVAPWTTGTETRFVGIVRDVAERKRADEALAERTRQLEAVRGVATEITRELDLTTLLHLITRRAARLGSTGGPPDIGEALLPVGPAGGGRRAHAVHPDRQACARPEAKGLQHLGAA